MNWVSFAAMKPPTNMATNREMTMGVQLIEIWVFWSRLRYKRNNT